MNFASRRVTIMGLGHFGGGVAAARWLARHGANVTVTDLADEATLADSLAALDRVPIAALHLGGHREESFQDADLVVVNPAVRPNSPFLRVAQQAGAELISEIELFLNACPGRLIGVTGSNGKSTTAAMIAAIFRAADKRTWLGGNLGNSLLDHLEEIRADDSVILELSSFQLWHLSPAARMPEVAVVTNCSANHLDWHGSFGQYVAAKQRILTGQSADGLAVLGAKVSDWAHLVRGRRLPLVDENEIPSLSVPGEHNRQNAACAATATVDCHRDAIRRGLESFRALGQRLELLGTVAKRRFYNDSTATTPESTIAALEALRGPVWLLAGGTDKGFGYSKMLATIAATACGAAFYGGTGQALRSQLSLRAPQQPSVRCATVDEAFWWCWRRSAPGDTILFSPACASHDQFQNFRQRGEHFAKLVGSLRDRHDRHNAQPLAARRAS